MGWLLHDRALRPEPGLHLRAPAQRKRQRHVPNRPSAASMRQEEMVGHSHIPLPLKYISLSFRLLRGGLLSCPAGAARSIPLRLGVL